jgi:hypothetical protein
MQIRKSVDDKLVKIILSKIALRTKRQVFQEASMNYELFEVDVSVLFCVTCYYVLVYSYLLLSGKTSKSIKNHPNHLYNGVSECFF